MDQAQQQQFTDEELQEILDKDIIELMGLKDVPDEKKAEIYEKMTQTIQDRVFLRVDEILDVESKQQFAQVLEKGDQAAIKEFLQSKEVNVPQIMMQETMFYKLEIMSLLKTKQDEQASQTQN